MSVLPAPLARGVDAALEATVVLSFSRVGHAVRSQLGGWDTPASDAGRGRRIIVTGANSGLGYATAVALLSAGAHVLLTVRSVAKGEDTLARLTRDLGRDVSDAATFDVLDLSELDSVRGFATRRLAEPEPIDVLVHNAGAMFPSRATTVDGLERTYQIHVVAPFLLTSLLVPKLVAGDPGRVLAVTSGGMYTQRLVTDDVDSPDDYRPATAYARAKRAQLALTREWAARFAGRGVDFQASHPGWALTPGVESSLPGFRRITGPLLREPAQGADTIVYLALANVLPVEGRLWHDRRVRGEHRVPWTVPAHDEASVLWHRVCHDAGETPRP